MLLYSFKLFDLTQNHAELPILMSLILHFHHVNAEGKFFYPFFSFPK